MRISDFNKDCCLLSPLDPERAVDSIEEYIDILFTYRDKLKPEEKQHYIEKAKTEHVYKKRLAQISINEIIDNIQDTLEQRYDYDADEYGCIDERVCLDDLQKFVNTFNKTFGYYTAEETADTIDISQEVREAFDDIPF